MTEALRTFVHAARVGVKQVEARVGDQSFLEATLESAIAERLPGSATTGQTRRRFALRGFEPNPHGVDIDWRHRDVHVGVEVKVSDVIDSLFDVIKLATAIASSEFDEGYCATAATAPQWTRGGAFREMIKASTGEWRAWQVDHLLADEPSRQAVLVDGPRPFRVPSQIEAMSSASIAMPRAPTHTLRVLGVRPMAGAGWLDLPRRLG
jgi:hypothetical protein